ncbi:MAG TPA: hypothetical protein VL860_09970 [Planctomycetota bacterium]|nr:hypothetical protein [Planctomycetota bacterium]
MSVAEVIGLVLGGLGVLLCCLNFWLSFLRYPIHIWFGGTRDNYKWVSGFPLVGSLLLWVGAALLRAQPAYFWTALVISLFDTGGIHWFLAAMFLEWLHRNEGKS